MKNENTELELNDAETLPACAPENRMIGTPPLDVNKYQSHVEDFDLTEEQKLELLETLWSIMTAFVDLGFGADAVQYIFRDTGPNSLNSDGDEGKDTTPSTRFNRIAHDDKG
ncbi:MAG: hypothetical protein ACU841_14415 [Gammaproteobacteria bacterium]